jgi:hypothetical protein
MNNDNRIVLGSLSRVRSRTPSPKKKTTIISEFHRQHAVHEGNRLIASMVGAPMENYVNPMEDPEEPMLPRTSLAIVFGIVIAASIVIASYLMAIVVHEYRTNAEVGRRIRGLQDTQQMLLYNLTVIDEVLRDVRDRLLVIEFEVDGLQLNVTSLSQRIADINCTGIRTFNMAIAALDQFGHGGGNAWIRSGVPEFITVDTTNATITVNGTQLQLLIDAQETSLQLLQQLLSAVQAALAMLQQQALLTMNNEGTLANNIDFVGHCNATFVQGNNTVIIDGCSIRDEIDRQFQVVYAQFLVALGKIATLKASIAYIELKIAYTEQVIANVTQNGLMSINDVLPGVGGTFGVAAADAFLAVSNGPASNEIQVTNQAILTMNNGIPSDANSDFQISAGAGKKMEKLG